MTSLVELLGQSVINSEQKTVVTSELVSEGGVVGLYFSGACPPGRAFTSLLVSFYAKLQRGDGGKKFEIVFVSSDEEEEMFNLCLSEMPWHAVPFCEHELRVR